MIGAKSRTKEFTNKDIFSATINCDYHFISAREYNISFDLFGKLGFTFTYAPFINKKFKSCDLCFRRIALTEKIKENLAWRNCTCGWVLEGVGEVGGKWLIHGLYLPLPHRYRLQLQSS